MLLDKIQKCQLSGNGMFSIGAPNGLNHEYQIEDTPFQVESPVPVTDFSKFIPNADAYCPAWKISIICNTDNPKNVS